MLSIIQSLVFPPALYKCIMHNEEQVTGMEKKRNAYSGKLKGKRPLRIPTQTGGYYPNGSYINRARGSEYGPVAGPCENGNEPPGSIKGMEFLEYITIRFSRTQLHGVNSCE
jgi:hypothetical protein